MRNIFKIAKTLLQSGLCILSSLLTSPPCDLCKRLKSIINMWAACRWEQERLCCEKIVAAAFGLGPRLDGGASSPFELLGPDLFRMVANLVVRELSQVDDWAIVWPSACASIRY